MLAKLAKTMFYIALQCLQIYQHQKQRKRKDGGALEISIELLLHLYGNTEKKIKKGVNWNWVHKRLGLMSFGFPLCLEFSIDPFL